MAAGNYKDVELTHQQYLDDMARQRRRMKPITWCLRAVFALSRLLGFESRLFGRFLAPMSKASAKSLEHGFDGYVPTEHDVLVCSYIKSGTNWMMQVVHQIAHRGEGDFKEILNVVAWPDCPARAITIDINDPRPIDDSPTSLRAIKTHSPAQFVPYNEKAKYVCVVRDPKDVTVSAYHFFRTVMLGSLMPSVKTWVEHMQNTGFGSWADFTDSYWAWRDRPNVLFMTYEEMNDDAPATIRKIATLMGVELTEEEFAKVVHLSSFEYMKSVDHKFYPGDLTPFAGGGGRMVRSGKKGASGELLSAEQQNLVDTYSRDRLRELNSDFPYDEYYGDTGA